MMDQLSLEKENKRSYFVIILKIVFDNINNNIIDAFLEIMKCILIKAFFQLPFRPSNPF